LISELTVTCLCNRMVHTHNGQAEAEASQANEPNPPPPSTLAQAITSIIENRNEQTEFLWPLLANSARGGNGARSNPTLAPTTYCDFTVTDPPIFSEAGEPLKADHWLHAIESMFGLLHCTEVKKTLFSMQQLHGDASTWWANYTAAHPTDYQVPWAKSCSVFYAHYIPAGVMRRK
jgi:hypothetical protein